MLRREKSWPYRNRRHPLRHSLGIEIFCIETYNGGASRSPAVKGAIVDMSSSKCFTPTLKSMFFRMLSSLYFIIHQKVIGGRLFWFLENRNLGALPGSIQGQKSANRLKTRTRSHAFGAPLGFPEQIFYCQCRSSTLRATGTGVKYANFSASAIYTVKGGWISVKGGPAPFFKDRK